MSELESLINLADALYGQTDVSLSDVSKYRQWESEFRRSKDRISSLILLFPTINSSNLIYFLLSSIKYSLETVSEIPQSDYLSILQNFLFQDLLEFEAEPQNQDILSQTRVSFIFVSKNYDLIRLFLSSLSFLRHLFFMIRFPLPHLPSHEIKEFISQFFPQIQSLCFEKISETNSRAFEVFQFMEMDEFPSFLLDYLQNSNLVHLVVECLDSFLCSSAPRDNKEFIFDFLDHILPLCSNKEVVLPFSRLVYHLSLITKSEQLLSILIQLMNYNDSLPIISHAIINFMVDMFEYTQQFFEVCFTKLGSLFEHFHSDFTLVDEVCSIIVAAFQQNSDAPKEIFLQFFQTENLFLSCAFLYVLSKLSEFATFKIPELIESFVFVTQLPFDSPIHFVTAIVYLIFLDQVDSKLSSDQTLLFFQFLSFVVKNFPPELTELLLKHLNLSHFKITLDESFFHVFFETLYLWQSLVFPKLIKFSSNSLQFFISSITHFSSIQSREFIVATLQFIFRSISLIPEEAKSSTVEYVQHFLSSNDDEILSFCFLILHNLGTSINFSEMIELLDGPHSLGAVCFCLIRTNQCIEWLIPTVLHKLLGWYNDKSMISLLTCFCDLLIKRKLRDLSFAFDLFYVLANDQFRSPEIFEVMFRFLEGSLQSHVQMCFELIPTSLNFLQNNEFDPNSPSYQRVFRKLSTFFNKAVLKNQKLLEEKFGETFQTRGIPSTMVSNLVNALKFPEQFRLEAIRRFFCHVYQILKMLTSTVQ